MFADLNCNTFTEIEHNCSNTCPASCEEPDRLPCRDHHYCYRGCECRPGYVKEHQKWSCIPKDKCPKCASNEHFRDCGTNCEPTCSNYRNTPPHCNNNYHCKRGCFCNYGFVRDMSLNGTCVPIDKCPQKCGSNEYWDEQGAPCVRSATNPRPKCLDEPAVPACVCNTGFTRNPSTGQCEKFANYVEVCGGNETFSQCGNECSRKCFDETKRQFCPTICLRGCFCNEGYVRDSHNHRCVLQKDCYVWKPNDGIARRRRRNLQ
ncbi:zonadhesin-like [Oppia nitens]|uniref:zonadhesin-like n=1 Tax=Oppia nitens TaxID=1686743 RepID=UPI0023DA02FB|nr:zonadhesin-like [Oppia nitens]